MGWVAEPDKLNILNKRLLLFTTVIYTILNEPHRSISELDLVT